MRIKCKSNKLVMASIMGIVGVVFLTLPAWASLKYDGSIPIGEQIVKAAAADFEKKTGVKFDKVETNGTDIAVKAVVEGKVDIGGVARSLTASEKKEKIYYQIIGYDTLAVFLNPLNPITSLTSAQIKDIFLGKIANWKEVGGADEAVVVWANNMPGRAVTKAFQKAIMSDLPMGENVKVTTDPVQHIQNVADGAGVISFDSLSLAIKGVKTISVNGVPPTNENVKSGTYLLSRPCHLVTKGLPKGDVKKFVDFILSAEGQAIVKKAFVPVK